MEKKIPREKDNSACIAVMNNSFDCICADFSTK